VDSDGLTHVIVKFTGSFRKQVGQTQIEFSFNGGTMREFIHALDHEFDFADLLLDNGELSSRVLVVINGRYSYLLGGWDAPIPDGALIVLFRSHKLAF
jgi:hypothetical protein